MSLCWTNIKKLLSNEKNKTNDSLLLGGYSNLNEFVELFKNHKYDEKKINDYNKKYSFWNKKSILRLIEIIN